MSKFNDQVSRFRNLQEATAETEVPDSDAIKNNLMKHWQAHEGHLKTIGDLKKQMPGEGSEARAHHQKHSDAIKSAFLHISDNPGAAENTLKDLKDKGSLNTTPHKSIPEKAFKHEPKRRFKQDAPVGAVHRATNEPAKKPEVHTGKSDLEGHIASGQDLNVGIKNHYQGYKAMNPEHGSDLAKAVGFHKYVSGHSTMDPEHKKKILGHLEKFSKQKDEPKPAPAPEKAKVGETVAKLKDVRKDEPKTESIFDRYRRLADTTS